MIATTPFKINNRGEIVGIYPDTTGAHGFLLSNGTFTTIIAPGSLAQSFTTGIDDRGRITGASL